MAGPEPGDGAQAGTADAASGVASVTLTYDERRKSRQLLRLADGSEVALRLPRGTVLREGDRLLTDDGLVLLVRAACESLSSVAGADAHAITRAAYHLGNRHVPLQIRPGVLRYRHDHVLDDMVASLGMLVSAVEAPFEPEGGAYGGGHHHHHEGESAHHDHDHDHHHHDHHHHDHELEQQAGHDHDRAQGGRSR
jgi:urease accessory protein